MESQPQNPEFRNNPKNFHPYVYHHNNNMISHPGARLSVQGEIRKILSLLIK